MVVSSNSWSAFVLLGALSCGGGTSHSSSAGGAGPGGNADGMSGTGGSSSSASSGGKPSHGGSSSSAGAAVTGIGGTAGAASGTGNQAGGGTGSAGAQGACVGPDIDVPSVSLSGTIQLLDTPPGNYGTVSLSNGSDVVTLGTTASNSYSVRVVPGTYDLVFNGTSNGRQPFKTGVTVPSSGPAVLDIEIPRASLMAPGPSTGPDPASVMLSGKLTFDGQVPNVVLQGLVLTVRKLGTDNWLDFSRTTSSGYSGLIVPGSYDIAALETGGEPILPGWSYSHILATGVVVPNTNPAQVDIDVRTAPLSGAFTVDGAVPPPDCNGELSSAKVGGLTFALDAAGAFSGRVLPETYDVVYRGSWSSVESNCPKNTRSTVKRGLVVPTQGLTLPKIDIPTVMLTGKLTLGGAALSNSDDEGTLFLRTDEGDEVTLGKLSAGSFSARVIAGTYDVYFDVTTQQLARLAPLNGRGKIKSVVLTPGAANAPVTLDIDVPSTLITGTIQVGGNFLDKEYDGGRLWLGEPKSKAGIPLAWTSTGKYSVRVLPGTYDLFYQGTSPSALAPLNPSAKLGCFVVK